MRRLFLSTALCTALAATATAGDLTVAPGGIGADFGLIQDAIDVALPGDRILVAIGNYQGFVLDKPLAIIADGSGIVRSNAILVTGIPAGGVAVISGIDVKRNFDGYTPPVTEQAGLTIAENPGTVVLHDLDITDGPGVAQQPGHGILIENSARVLASSCTLSAIPPNGDTSGLKPGALTIHASSAWFADSSFQGTIAIVDVWLAGGPGRPAIEAEDSDLRLTGCTATGGPGIQSGGFIGGPVGHPGGPALRASSSTIRIADGPPSLFQGGDGAGTFTEPGGPALDLLEGAVATVAADVALEGGVDGCDPSLWPFFPPPCVGTGPGQAPDATTSGGSLYVPLGVALPSISLDQPSAPVGALIEVRLAGNPGNAIAIALAFAVGPPLDVSFIDGTIHGNLALTFALGPALFLDGQGEAALQLTLPDISFLHGLPLYFQALEEVGPGSFRLSDPAVFAIWP